MPGLKNVIPNIFYNSQEGGKALLQYWSWLVPRIYFRCTQGLAYTQWNLWLCLFQQQAFYITNCFLKLLYFENELPGGRSRSGGTSCERNKSSPSGEAQLGHTIPTLNIWPTGNIQIILYKGKGSELLVSNYSLMKYILPIFNYIFLVVFVSKCQTS